MRHFICESLERRNLFAAQFLAHVNKAFDSMTLDGSDTHAYYIRREPNDDQLISVDSHTGVTTLIKHEISIYSFGELAFDAKQNVYFFQDTSTHSVLWKSDGTIAGTKAIYSGPKSDFEEVKAAGSNVFFVMDGKLQVYNAHGTLLLKSTSNLNISATQGDEVYFVFQPDPSADAPTESLWKSDGTLKGTQEVASGLYNFDSLQVLGSHLIFTTTGPTEPNDNEYVLQFWHSDGTPKGMKQFLTEDADTPGVVTPVGVGDEMFFILNDLHHGERLWKTDGTASGTRMYNIDPNSSEIPSVVSDHLYFDANIGSGEQPFVADPDQNTVRPISPPPNVKLDSQIIATLGNDLYFTGTNISRGRSLYRSVDGGPAQEVLSNFSAADAEAYSTSNIYFHAPDPAGFESIYRFNPNDGSISGRVFADKNGDAKQQGSEKGLGGWRVFIDSNDDGLLDDGEIFARTSPSGHFEFDGLSAGKYWLRVTSVSGYKATGPTLYRIKVSPLATVSKLFAQKPISV